MWKLVLGCLAESSSRLRKSFANFWFFIEIFEKTCNLLDFLCISQMYIFHEKIITFLFVTLSHMIGFSSNFAEDVKYNYLTEYVHSNAQWHRSRGFLLKKHEISTVPQTRRLKIEKSMIFCLFLVLSSYCFLRVKLCVEHVFAGFRAIRCRKRYGKSALCCL